MVEEAVNKDLDQFYEPNNFVNSEMDLTRYVKKNIAEKYEFNKRKDENRSAYGRYKKESITQSTAIVPMRGSSSPSPIPGDVSDRSYVNSTVVQVAYGKKSYLTSISNTFLDDKGRSIMQRFFLSICGHPTAIEFELSVNIMPRNKFDKTKNIKVHLEIENILIEYSNDLSRNLIETGLTYVGIGQSSGAVINPDKEAIQKKLQFFASMDIIEDYIMNEAIKNARRKTLTQRKTEEKIE